MRIGLDVMGGDHAPGAILDGALAAVEHLEGDDVLVLYGDEAIIENAMEADGYDVTITILIRWDKETCSRPTSAHALNDFHDSEGRIGFWEPQINRVVDLDLDGDGFVNLAPYQGALAGPTERSPSGKCISVETFDDFEDLVRSGYPID